MKLLPGFDPYDYDYGPATSQIRTILLEWAEIDWFEPTGTTDEDAERLFREHDTCAHKHAPELFAERVEIRSVFGGWPEFSAWCHRVRSQPAWDWKFSTLKKLSRDHATAHGWSLESEARRTPNGPPRPGNLFWRVDSAGEDAVIWQHVLPARRAAIEALPRPQARDSANFYLSYAETDAMACMQWQLADPRAELAANPFLPLVRCYRAGAYPFSLDRNTVVLFRFAADEANLPKATLLRT